jgi:hypothetical protein
MIMVTSEKRAQRAKAGGIRRVSFVHFAPMGMERTDTPALFVVDSVKDAPISDAVSK